MRKVILTRRSGEPVMFGWIPNLSPRPEVISWHDQLFVYGGTNEDFEDVYVETKPYRLDDGKG